MRMSYGKAHTYAGILATLMVAAVLSYLYGIELILLLMLLVIVGYASGHAPDALEPPKSPIHRGKYHSWAMLIGLIVLNVIAVYFYWFWWLPFACAGYISHLVLDARTPSGLPLLYKGL